MRVLGEVQRGPSSQPSQIELGAGGVRADGAAGRFLIRFADLLVDLERGRTLVFREVFDDAPPDRAPLIFRTDDLRLLEPLLAKLKDRAEPELIEASNAIRRRRAARRWIYGLVGVIALLAAGLALAPTVAVMLVERAPISYDRALGDQAEPQLKMGAPLQIPALDRMMSSLVSRLGPHADSRGFEFRPRVVQNSMANAVALPGGRIVVTTGLLRLLRSPDELAGVLAHEMAHVTLRHGAKNNARASSMVVIAQTIAGDEGMGAAVGTSIAILTLLQYSREAEAEADRVGLATLTAAGISGRGLTDALSRLGEGHPGAPPEWLSTHPDMGARIAAIEALLPVEAPPLEGVDWKEVQSALPPAIFP